MRSWIRLLDTWTLASRNTCWEPKHVRSLNTLLNKWSTVFIFTCGFICTLVLPGSGGKPKDLRSIKVCTVCLTPATKLRSTCMGSRLVPRSWRFLLVLGASKNHKSVRKVPEPGEYCTWTRGVLYLNQESTVHEPGEYCTLTWGELYLNLGSTVPEHGENCTWTWGVLYPENHSPLRSIWC